MSGRIFKSGLGMMVVGMASAAQAATLIGKWDFNEGSGAVGLDSSGNGNNATLVAGPGYVSTGAGNTGVQLTAAMSQYIDYGAVPLFDITGPLTLESWFNLLTEPAKTGEPLIFGKDHTLFGTTMWGAQSYSYLGGGNYNVSTAIALNQMHHLVNTWDGTTLAVYLDGALIGTKLNPPAPNPNLVHPLLSGKPGPSDAAGFIDMIMDEARIYTGALSEAEVLASYAAGPSVVPEPVSIGLAGVSGLLLLSRKRRD
jgi:hypothetical protein